MKKAFIVDDKGTIQIEVKQLKRLVKPTLLVPQQVVVMDEKGIVLIYVWTKH